MYKVIANEKELQSWLEEKERGYIKNLIANSEAVLHLQKQIQILDSCYGEGRDIKKDLGGYMVIFYGKDSEVQREYEQILHFHHLEESEYEYEDCYQNVQVRLYICSSDYGLIMVSIIGLNRLY